MNIHVFAHFSWISFVEARLCCDHILKAASLSLPNVFIFMSKRTLITYMYYGYACWKIRVKGVQC